MTAAPPDVLAPVRELHVELPALEVVGDLQPLGFGPEGELAPWPVH